VRTEAESLAIEGPYIDDAYGRIFQDTPENRARRAEEEEQIRKKEEADRIAAEKAEEKRLRQCARRGISEEDCPRPADELEPVQVRVGTSGGNG